MECHLPSSVSPLEAWQDELSIAIKHHHVSPTHHGETEFQNSTHILTSFICALVITRTLTIPIYNLIITNSPTWTQNAIIVTS